MDIETVTLAYFSPTGTTRRVLTAIAQGIGVPATHLDLTLAPAGSSPRLDPSREPGLSGDLAILGAPVYAGRIPATAVERFRRLAGRGAPVVLVVVYGNRAFEDALLELSDLACEIGCVPVAGAAFIGEHSYAAPDTPIAVGRPDGEDLRRATAFGQALLQRLTGVASLSDLPRPLIPGNRPHRRGMRPSEAAPITDPETCTLCGRCAEVCPVGAVEVGETVVTDGLACILCCACTRACPTGARVMVDEGIRRTARWLYENHAAPKSPEVFW